MIQMLSSISFVLLEISVILCTVSGGLDVGATLVEPGQM
jgi:hypothetical protein